MQLCLLAPPQTVERMWNRVMHYFILLLALTALTWPSSAWAGDPLGTAGPFRSTAWAPCEAGVVVQFTGACDPPPVDPKTPSDRLSQAHVDRALKLVSLGRVPQARAALDEAVRADARNITALKLRARIPDRGNDAEADVNAGLAIDPLDADLMAMRAYILHGRGDPMALSEANRAVSLSSRNADVLWIRARIFLETQELQEAEDDLTRALDIENDYFRARQLRGVIRLNFGRFGDALEDANIAVNQQPWNGSALHVRAMARAGLGDFQGLVADLTTVLGEPGAPTIADPSSALNDLYIQRAIALVRLGRAHEAMMDIDTITKLGGARSILKMQVYLRSNGFPDIPIDGRRTQLFEDAIKACFINQACGRGIAEHI